MLERFRERRSHALLLKRKAHLIPQGTTETIRGGLQRGREADARLEAHDDLIDEVRSLALDLDGALRRPTTDVRHREGPAADREEAGQGNAEEDVGTHQYSEPREHRCPQHTVAQDGPNRGGVHPGPG